MCAENFKSAKNSDAGLTPENQKPISCAGAGDIEQVSLRFVYFIELGLIGDGFDAVLQRQNVIIAGRDHHGLELKPFGEVHCADGNAPFAFFHAIGKLQRCLASFLYDRTRTRQFVRTTDEYANFIGFGAVFYDFTNPKGKVADFLFTVCQRLG